MILSLDGCYSNDSSPGALKGTLTKRFSTTYDKIKPIIQQYGLSNDQLNVIMDLILSCKLGTSSWSYSITHMYLSFAAQFSNKKMIKLLLPRQLIPSRLLIRVFGKLSCRDVHPAIMVRIYCQYGFNSYTKAWSRNIGKCTQLDRLCLWCDWNTWGNCQDVSSLIPLSYHGDIQVRHSNDWIE